MRLIMTLEDDERWRETNGGKGGRESTEQDDAWKTSRNTGYQTDAFNSGRY